ncbi:hypothetical protein V6N13_015815 [Hibiscus sabdariffa]
MQLTTINESSFGDPSTALLGPDNQCRVSLERTIQDIYTIGSYDFVKDIFTPEDGSGEGESGLRYDHEKFYASKTFFDGVKGRRILTAWINESSIRADTIKRGGNSKRNFATQNGKRLVTTAAWKAIAQADVEVCFEVTDLHKAEVLEPIVTDPRLYCNQRRASS